MKFFNKSRFLDIFDFRIGPWLKNMLPIFKFLFKDETDRIELKTILKPVTWTDKLLVFSEPLI